VVIQNHKKLHEVFGVSKSSLYYKSKKHEEDLKVKQKIEKVWSDFPSYGHKRLAIELKLNKKRISRVMKKYNIKPYRRHRKPFKRSIVSIDDKYPNLLPVTFLTKINQIWATDFTYLWYRNRFIYVATVIDIYNREVVGACVLTNHSGALVVQALISALMDHPRPDIIHSDQGSEYTGQIYTDFCESSGIKISMSEKGSPWQNGYQESFYDKFKIDLGDPNRFETLGELVYEIYHTIYIYNTTRIHTSLKMSPREFAKKNCLS
jgi:transposase InsO family protein